jgi:peptide/nickel transport system ATP-binding protein
VNDVLLEAEDVTKHFPAGKAGKGATVHAVENASIALRKGKIVALAGESGSGKTTLARVLARYYPATSGTVRLHGSAVAGPPGRKAGTRRKDLREYHREVQLIFQDPFGSLNPVHKIGYTLERALRRAGHAASHNDAVKQVGELLERVGMPADFAAKFPHELSGGQRQRVVIARALAVRPAVLLGDEPVSMLDVSIRLDVLNLLGKLRDSEGLAILYITHDIASARYFSDEINVMYAGQMVEGGPTGPVIEQPRHPYTRLLLSAAPDPDRDVNGGGGDDLWRDLDEVGEPPSLINPPRGCRFHPRCPLARDVCRTTVPLRTEHGDGHWSNCWANDDE